MDEKCPDALLMLGDLKLKSDYWVRAKDIFLTAKEANDLRDSYATVCLVCAKLSILPLLRSFDNLLAIKKYIPNLLKVCFRYFHIKPSCCVDLKKNEFCHVSTEVYIVTVASNKICETYALPLISAREIGTSKLHIAMRKKTASLKPCIIRRQKDSTLKYVTLSWKPLC